MLDSGPMPLDPKAAERARRAIKFDGTINMGHILTFCAGMLAGVAAWNAVDKRVTVLEEARINQRALDERQDSAFRENSLAIRAALDKIDVRLERLAERELARR